MLTKKSLILYFSLIAIAGCSGMNSEIQDFGEPSAYQDTVARARMEVDDTWVKLSGKIVDKMGEGLYLFQDPTGEIRVRINDEAAKGKEIKTGMKIKLTGKVDKEYSGVEIAASHVEVLNR